MSSGISVFFIQKRDRLRRLVAGRSCRGRGPATGGSSGPCACSSGVRATSTVKRCVLPLGDGDGQRHLLEARRPSVRAPRRWTARAGRRRRQPAAPARTRRQHQSRREARPRSGPSGPRAIRASSPVARLQVADPGAGAPSPYGRRCPRPASVDPVDEAIALDAIEPFDLHRLELARRIGKRLAVGALGRTEWTAWPAPARPSTGRSTGSCAPAGRAPAASAMHSTSAPSGRLRRPCSRSTLKWTRMSPSTSSLTRKPKPRVASNHLTRPVDDRAFGIAVVRRSIGRVLGGGRRVSPGPRLPLAGIFGTWLHDRVLA